MVPGSTAKETSLRHERCATKVVEQAGCSCEDYGASPGRADRCTYISYADVKRKKAKQVAHASGDNEATQSFEQAGHPLHEENYNEVYENILQQLMETDEYDKFRVWTSDIEKKRCLPDCEEGLLLHGRR